MIPTKVFHNRHAYWPITKSRRIPVGTKTTASTTALPTPSIPQLPNLRGAATVRDLREAAALSPTLAQLLTNFAAADRVGQQGLVDQILKAWSDTSTMAATFTGAYAGHTLTVNIQNVSTGSAAYNTWADKLTILVHFNSRTFNAVQAGTAANDVVWKLAA